MKKKEKLKLLLNKVVEYNDPKAYSGKGCHFKAFLYKNTNGYYFKVVEVVAGTDLAFNDIIPLKEGDEDFLIIADKPKLMTVKKNSWHYRWMKFILRGSTPTPQDMQNGCPYFWLLIFAMFVTPFVVLAKAVYWVIMLIPKLLFLLLEQLVNSWVAGLDDEAAYDVYYGGTSKMPRTAKIFFENKNKYRTDDEFMDFFLSKKYSDLSGDDPDYSEKRQEIKEKWQVWREDLNERRAKQSEIERVKASEQRRKKREAEENWDAKMEPFRVWRTDTASWFRNTFTVERGRVNMIVKRTKQFVGLVVTLVILLTTFLAVNLIARGLMVAADWCIANWIIFAGIAVVGAACGLIYLIGFFLLSWGQALVLKYRRGRKVWYIEPFIYFVYYPLKYLVMAIAFVVLKILWLPIRFVFYTILFKNLLKPVGLFIAGLAVSLVKGIAGSTGIFGEYFGASYSDYCPGIEWSGFDDEDED